MPHASDPRSASPNLRCFRHAHVVGPDRVRSDWCVTVADERIVAVMPDADAAIPAGAEVVDLNGATLCPGFIDIHLHGVHTRHVAQLEHMPEITAALAAGGATAFLPGVGMFPRGRYDEYLAGLRACRAADSPGAMILGAHFESPYLNPKCINIDPSMLWPPDPEEYGRWTSDFSDILRMVTLSPELPGAMECIARLRAAGITVSIGHSLADHEQVRDAMAAGLQCACHLFDNVPIPFLNRENCLQAPCMDEYALLEDDLYTEIIPDGIHVAPAFVQLARRCKPADRVILVTDAQPGAGMPEGIFHLPDGRPFRIRPGDVGRLVESGRIVGSSLTMIQAVNGYMRHAGAGLAEAARAASLNPACLLGVDREMGSLVPGKLANMLVLDADRQIRSVYVKGRELQPNHPSSSAPIA